MLVDEQTGFVLGLVTSNVKHLPFHLLRQQASSHAPVTVNSPTIAEELPHPHPHQEFGRSTAQPLRTSPASSPPPVSPVIIPRLNFTIPCLEPLAPLLYLTSRLSAGSITETEYVLELQDAYDRHDTHVERVWGLLQHNQEVDEENLSQWNALQWKRQALLHVLTNQETQPLSSRL